MIIIGSGNGLLPAGTKPLPEPMVSGRIGPLYDYDYNNKNVYEY